MKTKRQLQAMYPLDPNMREVIGSLWREFYALYSEKYKYYDLYDDQGRPIDPWIPNYLGQRIEFGQAFGQDNRVFGNKSLALGMGNITARLMEIVMGTWSDIPVPEDASGSGSGCGEGGLPLEKTFRLFTLGNGTDQDNRSNALSVFRSGLTKLINAIKLGAYDHGEVEPEEGMLQYLEKQLQLYFDHAWHTLIGDAPRDNNYYVRQDGGWIVLPDGHPPLTIDPASASLASIDQNQVLTLTLPEQNQVTASNGLTKTGDNITLGGELTPNLVTVVGHVNDAMETYRNSLNMVMDTTDYLPGASEMVTTPFAASPTDYSRGVSAWSTKNVYGNIWGYGVTSSIKDNIEAVGANGVYGQGDSCLYLQTDASNNITEIRKTQQVFLDGSQDGTTNAIEQRVTGSVNELSLIKSTNVGARLKLSMPDSFNGQITRYIPVSVNGYIANGSGAITIPIPAAHNPVTIAPASASLASISATQVLTINPQVQHNAVTIAPASSGLASIDASQVLTINPQVFTDNYVDSVTLSPDALLTLGRTGTLPDLVAQFGTMATRGFWTGTMAQYAAIATKDPNTNYYVQEP